MEYYDMNGSKQIRHEVKQTERTQKGKFHYLRLLVNSSFPINFLNTLFCSVDWTRIQVLNRIPCLRFVIHHVKVVPSRNTCDVTFYFCFLGIFLLTLEYYTFCKTQTGRSECIKISQFKYVIELWTEYKLILMSLLGYWNMFSFWNENKSVRKGKFWVIKIFWVS